MKKSYILLILLILFLTGCSDYEPYIEEMEIYPNENFKMQTDSEFKVFAARYDSAANFLNSKSTKSEVYSEILYGESNVSFFYDKLKALSPGKVKMRFFFTNSNSDRLSVESSEIEIVDNLYTKQFSRVVSNYQDAKIENGKLNIICNDEQGNLVLEEMNTDLTNKKATKILSLTPHLQSMSKYFLGDNNEIFAYDDYHGQMKSSITTTAISFGEKAKKILIDRNYIIYETTSGNIIVRDVLQNEEICNVSGSNMSEVQTYGDFITRTITGSSMLNVKTFDLSGQTVGSFDIETTFNRYMENQYKENIGIYVGKGVLYSINCGPKATIVKTVSYSGKVLKAKEIKGYNLYYAKEIASGKLLAFTKFSDTTILNQDNYLMMFNLNSGKLEWAKAIAYKGKEIIADGNDVLLVGKNENDKDIIELLNLK